MKLDVEGNINCLVNTDIGSETVTTSYKVGSSGKTS